MSLRALITGASTGIGFSYAEYLKNEGWYLDLVSKNEKRLENSKKYLKYKKATFHSADLSKSESIDLITNNLNTPDLIVANAGIAINGAIGKLNKKEKNDAYYLMCGGVIDLIEGFVPRMINNGGGRIVIISSIGAISAMPKSSIYSSIKSGIHSYGRSIASELKNKNISVTISMPGYVKTNAHKRAGLEHLEKKVPKWMWVNAHQVVEETEKASRNGKIEIIPGKVYRFTKPFLRFQSAINIWRYMTKRN